jgi:hypothetical protein
VRSNALGARWRVDDAGLLRLRAFVVALEVIL